MKTIAHLSVHLAGARRPDLILKLMSHRGLINGACGADLACGLDFADPYFNIIM